MIRRAEMNAKRAMPAPVRVILVHRHALGLLAAALAIAALASVARRRTLFALFISWRRPAWAVLLAAVGAAGRRRWLVGRRRSVCLRFRRRWRRRGWGRWRR